MKKEKILRCKYTANNLNQQKNFYAGCKNSCHPLENQAVRGKKIIVKKTSLDKLAQSEKNDKLLKRNYKKFLTIQTIEPLLSLNSKYHKYYLRTLECCNVMEQKDGKIVSHYCNSRFCYVCNGIRTAKLIKGYLPIIEGFEDKRFLTLTIPNPTGDELKTKITQMYEVKKKINWRLKKQARVGKLLFSKRERKEFRVFLEEYKESLGSRKGLKSSEKNKLRKGIDRMITTIDMGGDIVLPSKIKGIFKLEITYNQAENNYHPHIHAVVNSEVVAFMYVYLWLKEWKDARLIAQDVRQFRVNDSRDLIEMFKYVGKLHKYEDDGNGNYELNSYPPEVLDTIMDAIYGRRLITTVGINKQVSEEVEEEELVSTIEAKDDRGDDLWVWDYDCNDWRSWKYGDYLNDCRINEVFDIVVYDYVYADDG